MYEVMSSDSDFLYLSCTGKFMVHSIYIYQTQGKRHILFIWTDPHKEDQVRINFQIRRAVLIHAGPSPQPPPNGGHCFSA